MTDPFGPAALRSLTERLVAFRSVSPDPSGEARCAAALHAALPDGVERGLWPTPDGRPVVWALARGRSAPTVMLLGHYDTVGYEEYAALGATGGAEIALDPAAVRAALLAARSDASLPAAVREDLEEERRAGGTWLFGRGAFDMKSGLAAGLGALAALAGARDLEGHVLFVATPDEENRSAGMEVACHELAALRDRLGLELLGAINLDSVERPVAYAGVMGKQLVGLWITGRPAHAGDPFAGVDAAQIAAEIVTRATRTEVLVDHAGDLRGPPAVALRMRDLKRRYDLQTVAEAEVELSLLTFERPLERTFELLRELAASAIAQVMGEMGALRRRLHPGMTPPAGSVDPGECVLDWAEFLEKTCGAGAPAFTLRLPPGEPDERAALRGWLRVLAEQAKLSGPRVVLTLLPPYYPAAAPGHGPLVRAARATLGREGIPMDDWYPLITDASYLRAPASDSGVTRWMPAIPSWHPPLAAASRLDLDVISLGPWGRDAHGLYERVHAPYAFERLPRLLAAVVRETLRP